MPGELTGIPAAPGLAKGPALKWSQRPLHIPEFSPANLQSEKARLAEARQNAVRQLRTLVEQVTKQIGEAEASLFEAQAMILEDLVLIKKADDAMDAGMNAEQAWYNACEYFAVQLESLPDETLRARSADVRDIGRRVIEILSGATSAPELGNFVILIARDLAPSQTIVLDPMKVLAFCTAEGGPTSHTAILAKALGIPAVVGLGEQVLDIPDRALLLVDGTSGRITSDPAPDVIADFDRRILIERKQRAQDAQRAFEPAITRDGHRVEIVANVGSVEDARIALKHGAEGIGLLRTEFLFLNRSKSPDEETQFAAYRTIMEMMEDRPVVARTLDVGGDKEVPYLDFGREANPFLGYRAIRISLDHPREFKVQLRALLRAGAGHDLRIMFPMIATLDEVRNARNLVEEAQAEVRSQGMEKAGKVQVGIMIEIPSVALMADQFAHEVDFFSIGTNDLTQYTFAAERGNKRVSRLNDPCHPAVLKEIQFAVTAAHRARIRAGVCGEMAGDLQAIPILLGLGVDEFSLAPMQIPSAKQAVRNWALGDAQQLARYVLQMDSATTVREAVIQFVRQSSI